MDRRKHPRIEKQAPAKVHVLGKKPAVYDALILDASARGLQVRVPSPLLVDQAVRVEMADSEIFAEVCHCQANADGTFSAGLWIHEVLSGLNNLRDVLDSFQAALHPDTAPKR